MNLTPWLDLATAMIDLLGGACGLIAAGVALRRRPRRSDPAVPPTDREPRPDA